MCIQKSGEVFYGEDTTVGPGGPGLYSGLACRADSLSEMTCRQSAVRILLWILEGDMGPPKFRKRLFAAWPRVWGKWCKLNDWYGE